LIVIVSYYLNLVDSTLKYNFLNFRIKTDFN
jgi:hypothetical protein